MNKLHNLPSKACINLLVLLYVSTRHTCIPKILYSGKYLWEKFLQISQIGGLKQQFSPWKMSIAGVVNWAFSNLRNFSLQNLTSKQVAKIFFHENFPLYGSTCTGVCMCKTKGSYFITIKVYIPEPESLPFVAQTSSVASHPHPSW